MSKQNPTLTTVKLEDNFQQKDNDESPGFRPQPMVGWYNAPQLFNTALRTVISSVFGSYADKREIQAALSKSTRYTNYKEEKKKLIENQIQDTEEQEKLIKKLEEGEIWLDYVSDTGDGFDSTFTIAKLLAEKDLQVGNNKTSIPRGDILIMGGDQVYPVASREEYRNRLQGPFERAFQKDTIQEKDAPFLFAIPGNHDWYDGLTNFMKIFCQQRHIGNWKTKQERSYFAIKVQPNLWIWGIDIQLEADVDKPQLDYFDDICSNHIKDEKANIILCTAEPSWVFSSKWGDETYKNLEFFEKRYFCKETSPPENINKRLNLILTIAGDLHHYSRYCKYTTEYVHPLGEGSQQITKNKHYIEKNIKERNTEKEITQGASQKNELARKTIEGNHKITSGGGGAFLHPTHNLKKELPGLREGTLKLAKTYPERSTSRGLVLYNLLFPVKNVEFSIFIAVFYMLFMWGFISGALQISPYGRGRDIEFIKAIKYHDSLAKKEFSTKSSLGISTTDTLATKKTGKEGSKPSATFELFKVLAYNPFLVIIIAVVILGLIAFTDAKPKNFWIKLKFPHLLSILHGAAYITLIYFLTLFLYQTPHKDVFMFTLVVVVIAAFIFVFQDTAFIRKYWIRTSLSGIAIIFFLSVLYLVICFREACESSNSKLLPFPLNFLSPELIDHLVNTNSLERWEITYVLMEMFLLGGIIGGIFMGIYFVITNFCFGVHDNEAFSALKIKGYKNFLRIKITSETITIYPIGVKNILDWKWSKGKFKPTGSKEEVKIHLIEEPIEISLPKI